MFGLKPTRQVRERKQRLGPSPRASHVWFETNQTGQREKAAAQTFSKGQSCLMTSKSQEKRWLLGRPSLNTTVMHLVLCWGRQITEEAVVAQVT
ncbi:hypothetical protein BaRGS_00027417 [Batillaria attramentaria]|uniref:Uncharacterized protein n=1 Tax=Batillaria attramentaria TaxID=370345 RepID=A0ABD0K3J4_9CAEN